MIKGYKKILIIFLFIILFITIFIFCYKHNNKKYSGYYEKSYLINDMIDYNGINMHVENFEIYNKEEFKEKYDKVQIHEEERQKNIIVTIVFNNNTNVKKTVDLSQFILQSENWFTYLGVYTFYSLNKDLDNYVFELNAKEIKTVYLPFSYIFIDDEVIPSNFNDKKFVLNFEINYPDKHTILLN